MSRTTASETPLRRAKRPATPIAGPYGHPFHPLLVTIPIGVWVAAFIFDLAAFGSERPQDFTRGAQWLVAIGIIGAVLAACAGLLDLGRLAGGTKARNTALIHMTLNLVVVALMLGSFFVRLNDDKDTVSVGGFVLSLIGLLILGVSGWLGGKLAYRYGVRVADEETQVEGYSETSGTRTTGTRN
jgi:uncharacterized membrane protein